MNKKYLAEFIGTFGLAVAVLLGSQVGNPLGVPLLAALVVGTFVYTIGGISGCHINPAVTLGLLSLKRIQVREAAGYIVAQFLGAALAIVLAAAIAGAPTITPMPFSFLVFLGELQGAGILTFGIASVVFGKTPAAASGLVIGGSLLVGVTIAGLIAPGAGILNPAIAFAVRSLDVAHLFGPIAGSLVGFWTYRTLS